MNKTFKEALRKALIFKTGEKGAYKVHVTEWLDVTDVEVFKHNQLILTVRKDNTTGTKTAHYQKDTVIRSESSEIQQITDHLMKNRLEADEIQ